MGIMGRWIKKMGFLENILFYTGAPLVAKDRIRKDFDVWVLERPARCSLCREMHNVGHEFVWIGDSSSFFRHKESYESLVIAGRSSGRSGACIECVQRYRPKGS